jgi:hypothetical protein
MALSSAPVGKLIARTSKVVYGSGVAVDTLLHTCTQDCKLNVLVTPQEGFDTANDCYITVVRPDDTISTVMFNWYWWYQIQGAAAPTTTVNNYYGSTYAWASGTAATARPKNVTTAGTYLNDFINGPLLQKGTKIYQRSQATLTTTEHCLFVVLEMQPEVMTYDQL